MYKIKGKKHKAAEQYRAYNNQGTLHKKAFRQKQDNRVFLWGEEPVIVIEYNLMEQDENPVKVDGAGGTNQQRKYADNNWRSKHPGGTVLFVLKINQTG